jgi:hypothetical protein
MLRRKPTVIELKADEIEQELAEAEKRLAAAISSCVLTLPIALSLSVFTTCLEAFHAFFKKIF